MSFFDSLRQIPKKPIFSNGKFLLPAFLLTFAYLFHNYHSIGLVFFSPTKMIAPFLFLCLLLIPVFFLVEKIVNNKQWSSLIVFLFALFFFTSEDYFNAIAILLVLSIFTWAVSFYILKKRLPTIQQILRITAFVPILVTSVVFILAARFYFEPQWDEYAASLPNSSDRITPPSPLSDPLPDIYYIVLDGYGREDILQNYYGYDNSPFIERLQDKGFIIPDTIHSNYAKTVSSVSSTLNMNYTSEFIDGVDDSMFWWLAKPFIEQSVVQNSLEGMGYTIVTIATDWDITNNTNADLYLKPRPIHLTDYEGYLLQNSLLRHANLFTSQVAFYPTNDSHRDLIHFEFKKLADVAKIPEPTYVFTHIVATHPPFVFDKDGNPISPDYGFTFNDASDFPGTKEDYRIGYVEQLQYINLLIEDTVNEILAQSETPPIIILQADHGPGMLTDFASIEDTCLQERFSIFAAYHLPGVDSDAVPNDITPVNLFRVIFNVYFNTSLPLLENASYYYKDTIYVYRTEDITAQLADEKQSTSCTRFLSSSTK